MDLYMEFDPSCCTALRILKGFKWASTYIYTVIVQVTSKCQIAFSELSTI